MCKPVSDCTVLVGSHDSLPEDTDDGIISIHQVKTFHTHPGYKTRVFDDGSEAESVNDWALLELVEPIEFKPEARPLHLPNANDNNFGNDTVFLVTGWGKTDAQAVNGEISLRGVTVPWISDEDCRKSYSKPKNAGNTFETSFPMMLCAGDLTQGKIDACQGDSGGTFKGLKTQQSCHGV